MSAHSDRAKRRPHYSTRKVTTQALIDRANTHAKARPNLARDILWLLLLTAQEGECRTNAKVLDRAKDSEGRFV